MASGVPATAEGELARTPLAHLLVYALERRLTGALFLTEPTAVTHVVRFVRGVPVKVRPGDGYALLGQMLVEAELVTEELLAAALSAKGLLGDILVLAGKVEAAALDAVLNKQFRMRMVRLFGLPAATTYRYCDGDDELIDWGGDPAKLDPLGVLWAGVRAHGRSSTAFDEVVGGVTVLTIHPQAPVDRFDFSEEERAVVDLISAKPTTLTEVETWELVTPEELRHIVYLLLIARCLDRGTGALPVGVAPRSTSSSRVAAVGRVQLRTAVHRLGAAAPDLPGDGERAPRAPRTRRAGPSSFQPREGDVEMAVGEEGARSAGATGVPNCPPQVNGVAVVPSAASLRSAPEELARARTLFAERSFQQAVEAAAAARTQDPANAEAIDLHVWARAQLPGADVKVLVLELDDVLRADDGHVSARYHRALLRERLSDRDGARRDLARLLEVAPGHADAVRELAAIAARVEPKSDARGFWGKLFGR